VVSRKVGKETCSMLLIRFFVLYFLTLVDFFDFLFGFSIPKNDLWFLKSEYLVPVEGNVPLQVVLSFQAPPSSSPPTCCSTETTARLTTATKTLTDTTAGLTKVTSRSTGTTDGLSTATTWSTEISPVLTAATTISSGITTGLTTRSTEISAG
jgi:hypothetical protein